MSLKRPTGSSLEVNISGPANFSLDEDSEENEAYELKHEVGTQTDWEVQKGRSTYCSTMTLLKLIFKLSRFEA